MIAKTRAEVKPISAHVIEEDNTSDGYEDASSLMKRLLKKKAPLSENARTVLEKRYLRRDDTGTVIETPEELFYRVAENIASAENHSRASRAKRGPRCGRRRSWG